MIKWPEAKTDTMLRLLAQGLHAGEIADAMAIPVKSVHAKCYNLGVQVAKGESLRPAPVLVRPAKIVFPHFEDISRQEARAIIQGSPPSGRFTVQDRQSLMGSTASMCVEI